jgi:Subtilase family
MAQARVHPQGRVTRAGYVSADVEAPPTPDYVVVELKDQAPVAPSGSRFAAPAAAAAEAEDLNRVLARFGIRAVRPQFRLPAAALRRRVEVATARGARSGARARGESEFRQSSFVQIVPRRSADAARLARALQSRPAVAQAYVAPRPVPAGLSGSAAGSRLFEPAQGYLYAAPNGIAAAEVWNLAGARGKGITICDIEGAWNLRHEDLPRGITLIGGTMLADLGWRNHGTAVLGEMVSRRDARGTVGISADAKAVVQSAFIDGVFNLPAALTNAADRLTKGDVILIELQADGPNGKYVAMQYWDDIFTAIQVATERGITVVEAAGNGNENFGLPIFNGTGLQKDSGAIVVGAGVPPANHIDFDGFGSALPSYTSLGVPRSRIFFSNYGKIVNVQAWGWHVTTLAYGDLQGAASENRWYTLRFSGTSSASPIVTGAVACLQGRAKAKLGHPLLPAKVRAILMATGTQPQPGPGVPLSQHIGPQPNLAKAMTKV